MQGTPSPAQAAGSLEAVEAAQPDGLPTPRRWWSVIAIWLAIAMTVLDSSIANVALPTIAHDLGAEPADAIWVVNAYQLAVVVSLLPLSALGELIGFRMVFRAGLALFTVASVICAFSHSLPALTAARAVQGLGASAVMGVNGALVRFTYPHAILGRGLGFNSMVVSASLAIGPTVASAILAVAPWPWLFGVNLPIGAAAMAIGWAALPETPLSARRFDWLSAILNAMTFGLVVTGVDILTRTKAHITGALETLAGVAVGWVLVRRELRQPRPMVPVDLLRDRMFALSVLTAVVAFAGQMMALVGLPFHFENTLHFSQVDTGLLLTPWPVALGLMSAVAGWLADRLSVAVLCAIGLAVFAAGLASLALLPPHPSLADIVWRMVVCGLGFGCFQSPNFRMMMTSAPRDRAGAAGAANATSRLSGQTAGAVGMAIFLQAFGGAGETFGLWTAAAIALAAAAVSLTRAAGAAKGNG